MVIGLIQCPYCGFKGSENDYKLLREPWRFRFYTVKRLECPKCKGIFQYYYGESPRGKISEYVIRMKPRPVAKQE